jgi:hypothetical protein
VQRRARDGRPALRRKRSAEPTAARSTASLLSQGRYGCPSVMWMLSAVLHGDYDHVGGLEDGGRGRISTAVPRQVADTHTLNDMMRTDSRHLRPIASDTDPLAATKVVARIHATLPWERNPALRLRRALSKCRNRTGAFDDLDAVDALDLEQSAGPGSRGRRLGGSLVYDTNGVLG